MNIFIRADSSVLIGTGHVMRCLALAEGLRQQGATVSFACRELPGNTGALVEASGYDLHRLPVPTSEYAQEGTLDWHEDAIQMLRLVSAEKKAVDWMIADHYALGSEWESMMRPHVGRIMAIDDLADRSHDCDLLLDQNWCKDFDTRYDALVPAHCRKLLGPHYALLRTEFLKARQELRQRRDRVERILIFFGGSDSSNETGKALEAMRLLRRPEIALDVVVGKSNPHKDSIRAQCDTLPNARFYCQVSRMAELMANADLAIGAGGSATWERFCLQLPSIVIAVAPNQEPIAEKAAAEEYLLYLGKAHEVTPEMICQSVDSLLKTPGKLKFLASRGGDLVDGQGVDRVVHHLVSDEMTKKAR